MGEQVKIINLAQKLIYLSGRNIAENKNSGGIEIREIGLRPGEKLYEELLISGKEKTTSNSKIFMSKESYPSKDNLNNLIIDIKKYIDSNDSIQIIKLLESNIEGYKNDN